MLNFIASLDLFLTLLLFEAELFLKCAILKVLLFLQWFPARKRFVSIVTLIGAAFCPALFGLIQTSYINPYNLPADTEIGNGK